AQEKASPAPSHNIVALTPDALEWVPASAALPAGAKVALLQGDPSQPGAFVVRIVFPAGYTIAPHQHPTHENVTVLRGTLNVGMGAKFDKAATNPLVAGTFATMPAGMSHFVWVDSETELQVHGTGPFTLNYVNPADDPRRKKP
ncbi:MAG TPA: cupin domain-containing protein, partial [Longimicrobiales bacterium]